MKDSKLALIISSIGVIILLSIGSYYFYQKKNEKVIIQPIDKRESNQTIETTPVKKETTILEFSVDQTVSSDDSLDTITKELKGTEILEEDFSDL